jgi:hypothetical protein
VHCRFHGIRVFDLAFFEQFLETRDADVTEKRARLLRYDGKVGVVALEPTHESPSYGIGRFDGECWRRVQVLDRRLRLSVAKTQSKECGRRTPRNLFAHKAW